MSVGFNYRLRRVVASFGFLVLAATLAGIAAVNFFIFYFGSTHASDDFRLLLSQAASFAAIACGVVSAACHFVIRPE